MNSFSALFCGEAEESPRGGRGETAKGERRDMVEHGDALERGREEGQRRDREEIGKRPGRRQGSERKREGRDIGETEKRQGGDTGERHTAQI